MAEERTETREQEVARVRGYLANQSMKRTPAQIVEALREAHQQFLAATLAIPEAAFRTPPIDGEWSAADVLAHVYTIATLEEQHLRDMIERGVTPAVVQDVLVVDKGQMSREQLIAALNEKREALIALVLEAHPEAHLDVKWEHGEFGPMHWREWLLFARVHTLDHAQQMQAIAAGLKPMPQEGSVGA